MNALLEAHTHLTRMGFGLAEKVDGARLVYRQGRESIALVFEPDLEFGSRQLNYRFSAGSKLSDRVSDILAPNAVEDAVQNPFLNLEIQDKNHIYWEAKHAGKIGGMPVAANEIRLKEEELAAAVHRWLKSIG